MLFQTVDSLFIDHEPIKLF